MLAPGLQGLKDVGADAGVLQEDPGFVNEKRFEDVADLGIADNCVDAMQDVEQKLFE